MATKNNTANTNAKLEATLSAPDRPGYLDPTPSELRDMSRFGAEFEQHDPGTPRGNLQGVRRRAAARAAETEAAIVAVRSDPGLTALGRTPRVQQLVKDAVAALDALGPPIFGLADREIGRLERQLGLNITPPDAVTAVLHSELRSFLLTMGEAERLAEIEHAFEEDDNLTIGAIFGAAEPLKRALGVVDGVLESLREKWAAARQPLVWQQLLDLRADVKRTEASLAMARSVITSAAGADGQQALAAPVIEELVSTIRQPAAKDATDYPPAALTD
jgi:hypothetical protein